MDSRLRNRLIRHAHFTTDIHAFFTERGYVEVETPSLAPWLIPEPSLEVFQTEFISGEGASRPLWLVPSPELWMKRLLAGGSGNIYQISRSFRNGDLGSPLHNPEFRLLEWYTTGTDCLDAIETTEDLFRYLLSRRGGDSGRNTLAPPFHRISMQEAFARYADIDLSSCQDVAGMRKAAERHGILAAPDTTWEEAFHLVFLTLVEPGLPRDRPIALTDYPALLPTTARRKRGTPWAERWELYVDGVEISNCYTEETDGEALRALLREEETRKKSCRVPHRTDTALPGLFPPGFPPCAGAALGVDRLEMVFEGEKSLEGVILFPLSAILRAQSETG